MLLDIELCHRVHVPLQDLNKDGQVPRSLVMRHLLHQLLVKKATEENGYFLAVTKLKNIEKDEPGTVCCECHSSECLMFRVTFCCRTFMPQTGEVMIGTAYRRFKGGVLLKCGPLDIIYLAPRFMPTYQYVEGEDSFFLSNDLSRIQKDVIVRFKVVAFKWHNRCSGFQIIATIDGDSLGPISSAGSDGMEQYF